MADDKKKTYTLEETLNMMQTVANALMSGKMEDTVFAAPQDVSTYDNVAATANGMVNNLVAKYATKMADRHVFRREHAVSAVLGAGQPGVDILKMLRQYSPDLSDRILGISGMHEGTQALLLNANGIASATSGMLGGVMNYGQMATNYRRAATQGSLALANNLNRHGGVDTDFTYGLNLKQAAVVGNNILADSSQYDDWMKKELARTAEWESAHSGEDPESKEYRKQRKQDNILTEGQIKGFRYGASMTPEAVTSFNEHIKGFQKEMNGFVASVSKITGSFEGAIDFLQDLTNGEAFSAGAKAQKTRDNAARVAYNLRALAADTGMPPTAMANIMNRTGGLFDTARGLSQDERLVGDRSVATNVAAMSAAAFAQWQKAHPSATTEQQEQARYRFESRAVGLAKGDAVKDNVMLAQLVKMGRISKEEALKLVESGDQRKVGNFLKSERGFGSQADLIRNNRAYMDMLTRKNADLVNEFDAASLDRGMTNESVIVNQRNALDTGKKVVSSMLSSIVGRSVTGEIADIQKGAMLDDDVLRKAGLDEQQIEKAKKQGNLPTASLRRYLVEKLGADERVLHKEASKKMVKAMRDRYGDKEGAQSAIDHFEELLKDANPEATDDEIKNMAISDKMGEANRKLNKTKGEMLKSKGADVKVMDFIGKAAAGEDELALRDEGFIKKVLESELTGVDSGIAEAALKAGLGAYNASTDAKRSMKDTMADVQKAMNDQLEEKGVGRRVRKLTDKKNLKEIGERHVKTKAAAALFDSVLSTTDRDDASKEEARKKFIGNLRDIKFEDVTREEGESDEHYAERVHASIAKAVIAATVGDKDKKNGALNADEVSEKGLGRALRTKTAQETVRKSMHAIFDKVVSDEGAVRSRVRNEVDVSKMTEEQRREYDLRKAADGEKNFNNAESRVHTAGDMNRSMSAGAQALREDYTKDVISTADAAEAKIRNKSLGDLESPGNFNDFQEAMIDDKLHMDDKMKYLREMFATRTKDGKRVNEAGKEGRDNKSLVRVVREKALESEGTRKMFGVTDAKDIKESNVATVFKRILNDPEMAKLDDKAFDKALDHTVLKELGLLKYVRGVKDAGERQMASRGVMSAYVAGAAAEEGEARDDAVRRGYRTPSLTSGGSNVSVTALSYLEKIHRALEEIASNSKKE